MKTLFNLLVLVLMAIPVISNAQCNPYFDYQEGTTLKQTNYNPKGKVESSQQMKIVKVTPNGNGQTMLTDLVIYDKKGEQIMANQMEMICEDGVFKMDMSRFVPPGMDQMEGVTISYDGDNLELPSSLSTGQSLPDARFTVNIKSDNPALAAMMGGTNTTVSNRKVAAKESITTDAGTFDCFKITYNTKVETKMMGMTRTFESKGVEWISTGVGLVRVENYGKKGDLSGYTELTSFSK